MVKNSAPQISRDELILRLSEPNRPLVIDVLPEEEYKAAHLPGAKNACVFSVPFLEDVKKLASEQSKALVLYGSSARDFASATAAEKLRAAGYSQVADYRGGLEDWRAAGQPLEATPSAARISMTPHDGIHRVDVEKSRIEWTGRNLMSAHTGTMKLQAGHLAVQGGCPVRGAFALDMDSIDNRDIEDARMRQLLIRHLKSDDFFDVQRFPKAELQLSQFKALAGAPRGSPNWEVTGELTLKGVTHEVSFPAILAMTPEGLYGADAHFDIDRTDWKVLYGSGKFYEKLGKHLVHDQVSLALKLLTLHRV